MSPRSIVAMTLLLTDVMSMRSKVMVTVGLGDGRIDMSLQWFHFIWSSLGWERTNNNRGINCLVRPFATSHHGLCRKPLMNIVLVVGGLSTISNLSVIIYKMRGCSRKPTILILIMAQQCDARYVSVILQMDLNINYDVMSDESSVTSS